MDAELARVRARMLEDLIHESASGEWSGRANHVESSHGHFVHRRLKGPRMRWAEHHVGPMLTLRNLHVNDRWDQG